MPVIEVKNLRKEFKTVKKQKGLKGAVKALFKPERKIVTAVDDVSFSIEQGEIVGYIGPNGAGKSTTVKMMSGILRPTSGEILINGISPVKEPFKKLVNQGMIQGRSNFVYRIVGTNKFVSVGLKDKYDTQEIHVDVNIVKNDVLNIDAFRDWRPEFKDAEFVLEDGKYICGWAIEKMSKSMFNVVNPDYIVEAYGADTLRMYEMFLGPLEQSKPWDTNGIDGVHKFLRRLWSKFYSRDGQLLVNDEKATPAELKSLHKTIKKVGEDIENFSFNTSVAAFMICLNELGDCSKREVLSPLVALIAPFAPHIAEELWHTLGNTTSVCDAAFPKFCPEYLVENSFEYPVMINGKLRFKQEYALDMAQEEIVQHIVTTEGAKKWLGETQPKKIIVVKGKIINIVM